MNKKKISNVIVRCPKCGKMTPHSVFDFGRKIYKCLICNGLHV